MRKWDWKAWLVFGVIVYVGLSIYFGMLGFGIFKYDKFGPNFYGALFGTCLSTCIALIIVFIGYAITRLGRAEDLNAPRFAFLKTQGQNLEEAFITFVDFLNLGGNSTSNLVKKTWQTTNKELWPDTDSISMLQSKITELPLPNSIEIVGFRNAFTNLKLAVNEIVRAASTTSVFEGKERLTRHAVFDADFAFGALAAKLISASINMQKPSRDDVFDPTHIGLEIKSAINASAEVLKDLCKLGGQVKIVKSG